MAKLSKNVKMKNSKKDSKYSAENEIIIGVTTKSKEKVRVDNKKTTRTNNKIKNKQTVKVDNKAKKIKSKNQKKVNNKKTDKKINVDKEEKIKKINKKRIIITTIILLFLILCGTIYYLTTPTFNISNIIVYGNEKNSVDTYISLSKINKENTNIFAFTSNSIKKNIKEDSYVEDVLIKRKLPNTIELYITERIPCYQIDYSNKYIYLSDQGYILETNDNKKDIPVIKGLSSIKENIQIGQRLNEDDLLKLDIVLKVINYCKYNSIENKITSINVSDSSNYILNFDKDKKTVYLGDASNLSERILWLKTILEKEKGNKGRIFINGDLNKDKVYFREEK